MASLQVNGPTTGLGRGWQGSHSLEKSLNFRGSP